LPRLLREYGADLVLYPSAGPETFSYTLSEAWAAGQPVLVPPIGALAERVRDSGAGFVLTEAEWRDDDAMLDRIESLLSGGEMTARRAAAARAAQVPQQPVAAMAAATLRLYDAAPARTPAGAVPLDRARVRDALGYQPWHPPAPSPAVLAARRSVRTQLARLAMRMRRTETGQSLYRRLPVRLVDALKSRLR
jgi:hypothetical protein